MKIDSNVKPITSAPIQEERPKSGRPDLGGSTPSADNSVQLSQMLSRLRSIEAGLGEGQVLDAPRVAEIKQAISEGRFRINADAVADRLLDTVRELIRTHKA